MLSSSQQVKTTDLQAQQQRLDANELYQERQGISQSVKRGTLRALVR